MEQWWGSFYETKYAPTFEHSYPFSDDEEARLDALIGTENLQRLAFLLHFYFDIQVDYNSIASEPPMDLETFPYDDQAVSWIWFGSALPYKYQLNLQTISATNPDRAKHLWSCKNFVSDEEWEQIQTFCAENDITLYDVSDYQHENYQLLFFLQQIALQIDCQAQKRIIYVLMSDILRAEDHFAFYLDCDVCLHSSRSFSECETEIPWEQLPHQLFMSWEDEQLPTNSILRIAPAGEMNQLRCRVRQHLREHMFMRGHWHLAMDNCKSVGFVTAIFADNPLQALVCSLTGPGVWVETAHQITGDFAVEADLIGKFDSRPPVAALLGLNTTTFDSTWAGDGHKRLEKHEKRLKHQESFVRTKIEEFCEQNYEATLAAFARYITEELYKYFNSDFIRFQQSCGKDTTNAEYLTNFAFEVYSRNNLVFKKCCSQALTMFKQSSFKDKIEGYVRLFWFTDREKLTTKHQSQKKSTKQGCVIL